MEQLRQQRTQLRSFPHFLRRSTYHFPSASLTASFLALEQGFATLEAVAAHGFIARIGSTRLTMFIAHSFMSNSFSALIKRCRERDEWFSGRTMSHGGGERERMKRLRGLMPPGASIGALRII